MAPRCGDEFPKALVAEVVAVRRRCLDHAVAKQNHELAGFERNCRGRREILVRADAERLLQQNSDTRLSAFGALTPGITIMKLLPDGWSADLKLEFYRQRSAWRLGGAGSPGLEPFSARWIQAGLSKTF